MKGLNAYLIYNGNCRQAMEFYQQCLGGELSLGTYEQMPGGCPEGFPVNAKNWIIHARLTNSYGVLMASDTRPDRRVTLGDNFFISLQCQSIPEAEGLFQSLAVQGTIEMPLQETFWAQRFAMLTDQFGIKWMINFDK